MPCSVGAPPPLGAASVLGDAESAKSWSIRHTVTEQAAKADALVDEAIEVTFGNLRFVPRVAEV
jgi:hypothetical protein